MTKHAHAVVAVALLASAAYAQDSRTVIEPVVPAACTVLEARLKSVQDGPYRSLAAADESKLDTARIQGALDGCAKGKAVVLKAKGATNAFLSGGLKLRPGVTLVVDKGATLFGSLDFKQFEVAPGTCGDVQPQKGSGCRPLIAVDNAAGAGVMGEGVIDGRGGVLVPGSNKSAWDIAHNGQGGRILPRLIVASHADDFTLYKITLKNSPNFHVVYNGGNGFTVWGVKIETPQRFPRSEHPLAHNTDGIDPGNGAKNITITHSYIRTGDDNVAIKGDGAGLTNMTVSHNHFYYGHGMSIGSGTAGGVSKVRVFDLTLDGTDYGLRIKSAGNRGGLVQDIVYEDVCIRNSPHPLFLTGSYNSDGASTGDKPPVYRDIFFRNVGITGGGNLTFQGYDHAHRAAAVLDNVFLGDKASAKYTTTFEKADITIAAGGSNVHFPAGSDATLTGASSEGTGPDCSKRFVPFPE